ncbi:hypothetical protein BC940DRAFT_335322 [Gongronella butleri]|nr:hypothetical protein BC940DRAFT_335322 [Gongronella butleri]
MSIDADFNDLLQELVIFARYSSLTFCVYRANSSILVLQRRNQYGDVPAQFLSPTILSMTHCDILRSMNISMTLDTRADGADMELTARLELLGLALKTHGPEKNVVLAVEALLVALKDLNLNDPAESELTASYIHPVIQGLFAQHQPEKVALW